MTSSTDLVKKVIESVSLDSILLKSSNSNIVLPPNMVTPEMTKIEINYSFSHTFESETKTLFSFVAADLRGTVLPEMKEAQPNLNLKDDLLFDCSCAFVARYIATDKLTKEECEAFTRTNALFNVYPYLREHINSELTKMGLLGIYLPLLKPVKIET